MDDLGRSTRCISDPACRAARWKTSLVPISSSIHTALQRGAAPVDENGAVVYEEGAGTSSSVSARFLAAGCRGRSTAAAGR